MRFLGYCCHFNRQQYEKSLKNFKIFSVTVVLYGAGQMGSWPLPLKDLRLALSSKQHYTNQLSHQASQANTASTPTRRSLDTLNFLVIFRNLLTTSEKQSTISHAFAQS